MLRQQSPNGRNGNALVHAIGHTRSSHRRRYTYTFISLSGMMEGNKEQMNACDNNKNEENEEAKEVCAVAVSCNARVKSIPTNQKQRLDRTLPNQTQENSNFGFQLLPSNHLNAPQHSASSPARTRSKAKHSYSLVATFPPAFHRGSCPLEA